MSTRLPDFFLVGAAKSGTSSLWDYLSQHPDVVMSQPKEPNFFVFDGLQLPPDAGPADTDTLYRRLYKDTITDLSSYTALFANASISSVVGEASVRYLYYPETPERIKAIVPDARIIVMLRHPIDRLYSHYVMNLRHLFEPLSLEQALEQEAERVQQNWGYDWHYVRVSLYAEQVQRYFDLFGRDRVKVVLYDDFRKDPAAIVQDIYAYLGVDPTFKPEVDKQPNAGYVPKSLRLQQFLIEPNPLRSLLERLLPKNLYRTLIRWLRQQNRGAIPTISADVRRQLDPVFKQDVLKLEAILGYQLPWYS